MEVSGIGISKTLSDDEVSCWPKGTKSSASRVNLWHLETSIPDFLMIAKILGIGRLIELTPTAIALGLPFEDDRSIRSVSAG
jgi:hypothetical protein